jgi:hypothetical protein
MVTFDHISLAMTVHNVPIPSWETLRDAPNTGLLPLSVHNLY